MIDAKTAKRIRESEDGKLLVNHLLSTIASLDGVSDIAAEAPLDIAVEVKARQLAIEKLSSALSTLLTVEEMRNVRDAKDDYSITT